MEFVLKLFDDILLSFTAHRTLNGTEVHITSFDPSKRARLPLGMEATDSSLERSGIAPFLPIGLMFKIFSPKTV